MTAKWIISSGLYLDLAQAKMSNLLRLFDKYQYALYMTLLGLINVSLVRS